MKKSVLLPVTDIVKSIVKNEKIYKKLCSMKSNLKYSSVFSIKSITILDIARSGITNISISVENSMDSIRYGVGNITDAIVTKVPNEIGMLASTTKCAARLTNSYLNFRSGNFYSGTLNGISGVFAGSSFGFRYLSTKLPDRKLAFTCYLISVGVGVCSDVLDNKKPDFFQTLMYLSR